MAPTTAVPSSEEPEELPSYNGNPLVLRAFLINLYEYLPTVNTNYETYAKARYMVTSRGETVVMSAEQATAIRDGTLNVLTSTHSFANPLPSEVRF